MKLINFLQSIGLAKPTVYTNDSQSEPALHHHDVTEGCELLDEPGHMEEQPFEDDEA